MTLGKLALKYKSRMGLYGTCIQEVERRLFSVPKENKHLVSDGLEEASLAIC
jgi:hypothetical protein